MSMTPEKEKELRFKAGFEPIKALFAEIDELRAKCEILKNKRNHGVISTIEGWTEIDALKERLALAEKVMDIMRPHATPSSTITEAIAVYDAAKKANEE